MDDRKFGVLQKRGQFHTVTVHGIDATVKDQNQTLYLKDFVASRFDVDRTTHFNHSLDITSDLFYEELRATADNLLETIKTQTPNDVPLVLIGKDLGNFVIKQAILTAIYKQQYSLVAEKASVIVFVGAVCPADQLGVGRLDNDFLFSPFAYRYARMLIHVNENFENVSRLYTIISFPGSWAKPPASTMSMESTIDIAELDANPDGDFKQLIVKGVKRTKEVNPMYLKCFRALSIGDLGNGSATIPPSSLPKDLGALKWIIGDQEDEEHETQAQLLLVRDRHALDIAPQLRRIESNLFELSPNARIIRFTFNRQDGRCRSTYAMLVSLILQLLAAEPSLFSCVNLLYQEFETHSSRQELPWRIDRLWAFLRSLLLYPSATSTICILYMIDDCDPNYNQFLSDFLLLAATENPNSDFQVIVTSRTEPSLPDDKEYSLKVVDGELGEPSGLSTELRISKLGPKIVELYRIRPELRSFEALIDRKLREFQDLLGASNFLTLLQTRQPMSTISDVRGSLESMSATLEACYQHFLDRIPTERLSWARWVLSWIVRAYRPLTVTELAVAVALQNDVSSISALHELVTPSMEADLGHIFGNMITIQNHQVFFIHPSMREFILKASGQPICRLADDGALADACIRYLSLLAKAADGAKDIGGESNWAKESFNNLTFASPHEPFPYAFLYWTKHYNDVPPIPLSAQQRKGEVESEVQGIHKRVLGFVRHPKSVSTWLSSLRIFGHSPEQPSLSNDEALSEEPIFVATRFRCRELVTLLLNSPFSKGHYPHHVLRASLELAIKIGDEKIIEELRRNGAVSPNELNLIADYGHENLVTKLLLDQATHSENTSPIPPPTTTALHYASRAGHYSLVKKFLDAGFDKDANTETGKTPLHLASQYGHVRIMVELLCREADVNKPDERGSFPLHVACEWQQPDSVTTLLEWNASMHETGPQGQTPLHLASKVGRLDIVKNLLDYCQNGDDKTVTYGMALKKQDNDGLTPLHLAAAGGHQHIVSELLARAHSSSKLDQLYDIMSMGDKNGDTPLHLAVRMGHLSTVEEFTNWTAKAYGRGRIFCSAIGCTNKKGQIPIHLAALGGNDDIAIKLCEIHVATCQSLDMFDNEAFSPLHLAARDGLPGIVHILLRSGAQANIADATGSTPLHLACKNGHEEVVIELLMRWASPRHKNSSGCSPLHLAAQSGSVVSVRRLLDELRDPDDNVDDDLLTTNGKGHTAFHLATISGAVDVIQVLLEYFSSGLSNVVGGYSSLIKLALENNQNKMVEFLIENMKGLVNEEPTKATEFTDASLIKTLLEAQPGQEGSGIPQREWHQIFMKALESKIAWGSDNEIGPLLQLAAEKGVVEAVTKIINEAPGVDPNAKDEDGRGRTPLILASMNGHEEVVKYLLTIADVNSTLDYQDASGQSAILYAATNGHATIFKYLNGRGIDTHTFHMALVGAAERGHLEMVRVLTTDSIPNQGNDDDKGNQRRLLLLDEALLKATIKRHVEVVSLLLSKGANPNVRSGSGETILQIALRPSGRESVLFKALLDSNKVTRTTLNKKGHYGQAPLFTAVWRGLVEVVNLLLDRQIDTEIEDEDGRKPIHVACCYPDIIRSLIRHGANIEARDSDGQTPLAMAIAEGYTDTAEVLLENGADTLAVDSKGRTPLHHAAMSNKPRFFDKVLRLVPSGEVNRKDQDGRSPLFFAQGPLNVEYLLSRDDIDVNQQDMNGHTALEITLKDRNIEKAKVLLKSSKIMLRVAPETTSRLLEYGLALRDEEISNHLLDADLHSTCSLDMLQSIAASTEDLRLIEYVLEKTGGREVTDKHGWPLSYIQYVGLPSNRRSSFGSLPEESKHTFALPSRWISSGESLQVHHEFLSLVHPPSDPSGRFRLSHSSIATARTNHPIPLAGSFSIEMRVLKMGCSAEIAIGFGRSVEATDVFPGLGRHSWGYQAASGDCYALGNRIATPRTIGEGDIFRCHIDPIADIARFEINEEDIGVSIEGITGRLYPIIGAKGRGVMVQARLDWTGRRSTAESEAISNKSNEGDSDDSMQDGPLC